jgi:enamine deaminase RidA (YjgF/YER057c/UK114 family)
MNIDQRLRELGIQMPDPPKSAGNYQPWMLAGNTLVVSGQFPIADGQHRYTGQVGAELTVEQGCAAARLSALNVLAQIRAALGDFDRLETLLRVEGHVASAPGWTNAPRVLNGASDLFVAVLGERGRHARTAFTPARLPWNLSVELVVTGLVRPDRPR